MGVLTIFGAIGCGGSSARTETRSANAAPPVADRGTPPELGVDLDIAPLSEESRDTALSARIRGRIAVLDFWATWCDACRVSIPQVRELARRYPDTELAVIGVHVGSDRGDAREYVRQAHINYPIYIDADYALTRSLEVSELPEILVFDETGRLAGRAREIDGSLSRTIEALVQARITQANGVPQATDTKKDHQERGAL